MAVQVACDNCGTRLTLKDDSRLGQKMKCPKCQSTFVAEEAEEAAPKKKGTEPKPKAAKGKKGASKGKSKKKGSQGGFPVVPVVLGSVVLLALIGVGIWFAFSGSGDAPAPVAETTPAVPMPDATASLTQSEAPTNTPSAPAESQASEPPVAPGILNTEWLPADSLLVLNIKPASIMNSPMVKPTIDAPLVKLMLSGYEQQYGLKLQNLESITIGMGMDFSKLPTGGPPEQGEPPPVPPLPQIVTAIRFSADFDDAGAQKLAQAISAASQQAAMAASQQGGGQLGGGATADAARMQYEMTMTTADSGNSALGDARARMNPGAAAMNQSSAPGGGIPSSTGSAPGMDPTMDPTMGSDLANAGGSGAGKPVPNVYPLAMAPQQPNAPPQPQFGLSLVNPRTLIFAPVDELKAMVAGKPTNPQRPFAFVKHDGDIVLAGQFEFISKIRQLLAGAPPEMMLGFAPMLEFYDQGVRGGSLALSLSNQLDIRLSISGQDAAAAQKASGQLQDQMKAVAATANDDESMVPESVQETFQTWLSQMKTEDAENVTTLSFSLSPAMLAELQKDAVSSAAGLMAGQPGMFGPIGGNALGQVFPGLGGPQIPRTPLSGQAQPVTSVNGLPEKTKLAVVAHWPEIEVPGVAHAAKIDKGTPSGTRSPGQPAGRNRPPQGGSRPTGRPDSPPMTLPDTEAAMTLPPGSTGGQTVTPPEPPPPGTLETVLELALVVTGRNADEIIQYQEAELTSAVDSSGQPLKRRNGLMVPLSTPQTWAEAAGVVLEANNRQGTVIPVRFDSLAGGVSGVSELTGQVNIRISKDVEEILLDLRNPQALPIARLQAAGVRVVIGAPEQGRPIYLLPDSERTVLVGLHPAPEGMPRTPPIPGGGQFAGGGYPPMSSDSFTSLTPGANTSGSTPGASDEEMRRQMEQFANTGGNPSLSGGGGNANSLGTGAPVPDRVGYVASYNPTGFQIPGGQTAPLILKVARNPQEQKVSFTFKNLNIPPRPSGDAPAFGDWAKLSEGVQVSDGVTTAYVRTGWAEPSADEKRSRLNVWIDFVGPDAVKVFSAGAYTLTAAVADDSKTLTLDDKHPDASERPRGFDPIDAKFTGVQTPPGTCRINFPLMALAPTFSGLSSLEGSLRVKMSDGIETAIVEKLGDLVGKRITNPVLNAEKAVPTLEYAEGLATLVFPSSSRERVLSIELVDAQGRYEPSYPFLISRQEKEDRYSFRVDEKSLKKLGLRVVLHKGIKNGTFNFKFENVPVPPVPTPPAEE